MEGDAGAKRRLNPSDADDSLRTTEVTADDSARSEAETTQTADTVSTADTVTAAVTAGDSSASKDASKEASRQASQDEADTATAEVPAADSPTAELKPERKAGDVRRGRSRLSRAWLAGVGVLLLLIAGGIGAGGYFLLRSHQESRTLAHDDAAALQAAKTCVAATQAPDTTTMSASEQKIIDCGTDEYRTQALLYTSMLVQAYQAANVHVQVSDMRAAVERTNKDGSIDVLVALRVKVSNDAEQNQETGYRLRVRMAFAEGSYRIAKLDQVTK